MTRGTHPASLANLRPGSAPGRRSPRWNLYRDGYEEVAEQISARLHGSEARQCVHVAPDGGVYCSPRRKAPEYPELELIGHYDSSTRTEWVEDDLLHWMREQTNQRAA